MAVCCNFCNSVFVSLLTLLLHVRLIFANKILLRATYFLFSLLIDLTAHSGWFGSFWILDLPYLLLNFKSLSGYNMSVVKVTTCRWPLASLQQLFYSTRRNWMLLGDEKNTDSEGKQGFIHTETTLAIDCRRP